MLILTIIVQNTSEYRDLGVATSGVTFFRTLGSSFGAAVFGAVYSNVLGNTLPAAIATSGVDPRAASTPRSLHALPADRIAPIVDAYAHTIHVVFLAAVPVAVAAFVLSLFLKEVPLRGTSRAGTRDVGDGFGMPENADRAVQLQVAIARLLQRKGRQVLPVLAEEAGTSLEVADRWCVAQVHIRLRVGADTSLDAIARRVRVPALVLQPAFQNARAAGYLAGDDEGLLLTVRGQQEIDKVVVRMREWLADELSDWGADDELLKEALGGLARRFVDEEPALLPAAAPALGVGGPAGGPRG
jgi:hypothetical protein